MPKKAPPKQRRKGTAVAVSKVAGVRAFDAGKSQRRLRSVPTAIAAINAQIRRYGKSVLARSRYLAANNPHAASAKETFVSALVGCGIKPSSLADPDLKKALELAWYDWTDEADADWLTDFYGLQAVVAAEMFEAGECFVRLRARFPQDDLSVPLQLQVLPAEMVPIDRNILLPNGNRVECGIEFDAIGRRVNYHFWRVHPDTDVQFKVGLGQITVVPADEVLHLYRPVRAGQVRGLPHTLSAIVTLAILDQYEDAELERKRIAALFGAFVTRPAPEEGGHPLGTTTDLGDDKPALALEPGATIDLEPGEDIKFAEPADVGGNYEAFLYRQLLKAAAGFGVPYAAMTGDLRQTSYGSIRAGLIEFRRRIEAMQHSVMVYQFCRPIWQRWVSDAVLAQTVKVAPADFEKNKRDIVRVRWATPRWEWIDPLKDLQAEKLAVDNGFKARDDVIEEQGLDPAENDRRIAAGRDRAAALDLEFGEPIPAAAIAPPTAAPVADPAQQDEQN